MTQWFNTDLSLWQPVKHPKFNKRGILLFVKRDDLIHKWVSGNKWRKLKYNIEDAVKNGKEGILTFGGAFSNHLLATASAANSLGMKSLGIVRGQELSADSNELLHTCVQLGMELIFVTRSEYLKYKSWEKIQELKQIYSGYYIIPEGGANYHGIIGCQEIISEANRQAKHHIDHWFVAAGTTTTACGMTMALSENQQLHVVPALKGYQTKQEMKTMFDRCFFDPLSSDDWLNLVVVHEDAHHGGYGKVSVELIQFIDSFQRETGISLDYVYTGKAMFALFQWVQHKDIRDVNIAFLHTGGLYGGNIASISKIKKA